MQDLLFLMLLTRVQSLLILMCHSGDYSQSDAVRGVVSVQENGSWEEPHDLNGLWPWRLRPLKLR